MNLVERVLNRLEETKEAEAARTNPRKRTPAQQKSYEASRKKYQETGKTPFETGGYAMSKEERLEKAGLGRGPHRSKKKK